MKTEEKIEKTQFEGIYQVVDSDGCILKMGSIQECKQHLKELRFLLGR